MPPFRVHQLPKICYRATDSRRPRWQCLLALMGRSAAGFEIDGLRIIQRNGSVRRQRTIRGDDLAGCVVQGAASMFDGPATVLVLLEPEDMGIDPTSLCVEILYNAAEKHGRCRQTIPLISKAPCVLDFPLVGPWLAANGRGDFHCVGMQFGFDFIKPGDWDFHENPPTRQMELGEFEAFGQELLAAASGTVVMAEGAFADFPPTLTEPTFPEGPTPENRKAFLGNHVVIGLDTGEYLFMAHLQQGSVCVAPGDRVEAGQTIGCVGNSGNTTGPHLHIEMLDGLPDFSLAGGLDFAQSGLPFGFRGVRTETPDDAERPAGFVVPGKNTILVPA